MASSFYDAFVAGNTNAEATTILQDKLADIISANRHLADDDVLIDIGNLIADQLAALQKQSPAHCYNYAINGTLYADLMPAELSKRELDIEERILRTATKSRDGDAGEDFWTKLSGRLAAKGVTESDLDLIHGSKVADREQSKVCSVLIALYREAAALPQREGATILGSLLSGN